MHRGVFIGGKPTQENILAIASLSETKKRSCEKSCFRRVGNNEIVLITEKLETKDKAEKSMNKCSSWVIVRCVCVASCKNFAEYNTAINYKNK